MNPKLIVRATLLLSLALLVAACSGCIGQRKAIKSQTDLLQANTNAIVFAKSLKSAVEADYKAHRETRSTLRGLHEDWRKRRLADAKLPLIEAKAAAWVSIQTNVSFLLREWQEDRHKASAELTATLEQKQAPLKLNVEASEKASVAASNNAAAFPNDRSLVMARIEADRTYLAAVAAYNTIELQARLEFASKWDKAETNLTAKLFKTAEKQQQVVLAAFDQAVTQINAIAIPAFKAGPEPTNNAALLDELVRYTKAVELTGEAMKDYLESNSLGKGSFFHGALKAFFGGFFNAMPIIGTGKGATLAEVKSSAATLLESTQEHFKQVAKTAGETAKTTMTEALAEAIGNVTK